MHCSALMNPTQLLLESCRSARRSALMATQRLTDHDPASHRQAVDLDATVRISGGELRAQVCRIRNLSLGGAFIELHWLPAGTLINVTFGLPTVDDRLSLDAIVHWCSNDGVSVLFDSLRAWEVWVLWRYLSGLENDAEQEPTKRTRINVPVLEPAQEP